MTEASQSSRSRRCIASCNGEVSTSNLAAVANPKSTGMSAGLHFGCMLHNSEHGPKLTPTTSRNPPEAHIHVLRRHNSTWCAFMYLVLLCDTACVRRSPLCVPAADAQHGSRTRVQCRYHSSTVRTSQGPRKDHVVHCARAVAGPTKAVIQHLLLSWVASTHCPTPLQGPPL